MEFLAVSLHECKVNGDFDVVSHDWSQYVWMFVCCAHLNLVKVGWEWKSLCGFLICTQIDCLLSFSIK